VKAGDETSDLQREGARSRTITWEDPLVAVKRIAGMSGLEAVQAGLRGELPIPPMAVLLGIRGVEAEEGCAVLAAQAAEYHANMAGAAHGALAAGLLDGAMTTAALTLMPAGAYTTTLQLSVTFLRPLPMDGSEVRAEGRVLHRGRRTVAADGAIRDANDRLCAHATTSCLVMPS
jgi:uncharacterized protein (TIGR00369 family)